MVETKICERVFQKNNLLFDLDLIRSSSRKSEVVMHRKVAAIALHQAGYSYPKIGEYLHRSHGSIFQLVNRCPFVQGMQVVFPEPDKETLKIVSKQWSRGSFRERW